jgi:hypothetical protein
MVWFILAGSATSDPALWVSNISSTNQSYDSMIIVHYLLGSCLVSCHAQSFHYYSYYQPWRHKGAGTVVFFLRQFCQLNVWWSWCGRAYSTAPFIKFVIFHLCTARAINACLTSLSAGSFDMKNVILWISGINLLLLLQVSNFSVGEKQSPLIQKYIRLSITWWLLVTTPK